ncbi:MAG TPA: YtxH domain-containing protein [Flavobacterium sp.]|uniref:YtxH domain-containing protein n=1 Tax=Flavobacterium sp. TaxID=239 RepID=UPI002DB884E2|nr:YtxH domain-containing protein [Flavobacterium sp.]HEU4790113.1 YtxH domain-containing protein [Flavobacterium sp.]
MSNNTGNTIVAILVGAAIGAGIGILFAPDKGSKTREKIKDGFDDAKHNLQDKFHDVSEKLVGKAKDLIGKDDIDGNYQNIVSSLSHKTEDVISFLENKLAELKLKNAKFQK